MKILYVTDLHGDRVKYDKLYGIAVQHDIDIVINGGDMLPKQRDLFRQNQFISAYLTKHFELFEKAKIYYLCMLGNDDLKIFDDLFEEACQQQEFIKNIAQKKITISNFEFVGMNWVTDYPFRLKDRCRRDSEEYKFQKQYSSGLLSTTQGWQEIDNWYQYAATLPTIEEELENLPHPASMQNAIYTIHMPPANLGLDVCCSGDKVGSTAVYNFLLKRQPKLSLHGHIHESPDVTGVWKAPLRDTICIQPGQGRQLRYAIIDLEKDTITNQNT